MIDPIRELKVRAEILHHAVATGDAPSTLRLRALPELRRADAGALGAFAARIQRKHCLAAVAREAGFETWEHALRVLRGESGETDHGELLYPKGASAFLNHLSLIHISPARRSSTRWSAGVTRGSRWCEAR